MLICAEIGLLSEARGIFERLVEQDCRAIRRDDMYMTCLVFCAETCCALADVGVPSRSIDYCALMQGKPPTIPPPCASAPPNFTWPCWPTPRIGRILRASTSSRL